MRCQEVRLELISLLDNELDHQKKASLQEHLANCSSCAKEYLRLQTTEQTIREGLDAQPQNTGQLGQWVVKKAAELNAHEVEERQKWVTEIMEQKEDKPLKRSLSRRVKVILSVAMVAVFMFVYWPQVVRVSAGMPIIGQWVEQLVLKDAGLEWAYKNGYMDENRIMVEEDGVRLTVLATVADPIMTTVIYLIEGGEDSNASIFAVNGEGVFSWAKPPVETPLGFVGMVHTDPLPEGENIISFGLKGSKLELEIPSNREEISRVSKEYPLDYRKTVDGVTVEATRVVYSPTQILVEYRIKGGSSISGSIPEEEAIRLVNARGDEIRSSQGRGMQEGPDQWFWYQVFERPRNIQDLKMIIPVLGKTESVSLEFTVDDVGRRFPLDSGLELVSWKTNGEFWKSSEILELGFSYNGKIRELSGWVASNSQSEKRELPRPQRGGYSGSSMKVVVYGLSTGSFEPVSVTATEAQFVIQGEWEIPLPGID